MEENFGFISLNDRTEALEKEVQYHLSRALRTQGSGKEYFRPNFRVEKKYTHITYPEFKPTEKREQREWELEEIRRCKNGYDGLTGKYYYYFNHVRIKDKEKGKIRPDFRAIDLDYFRFLEEVEKKTGRGVVCIKRRQVGMSWKASADALYDCSFKNDFEVGMSSKSETDSRNLFRKIKYIHQNIEPFLKPIATASDRRDFMEFAKNIKDEFGNKKKTGTQSQILSVAPTDTSHAGNQYRKLILDESGEVENLLELWANAEPCLERETRRVGTPIIFGTVGDVGKQGKGLIEFWRNHAVHDLDRFAFWGYNGMIMDEFGNDDLENSIRWVIYRRKKLESGSEKIYNKFKQKYPLNEEDAFLDTSGAGVGNSMNLSKRYYQLQSEPAHEERGMMRPRPDGGVDFVPMPFGKVIVYERPQNIVNGYHAPVDPAEDDDVEKTRDTSNLSLVIMKKPFGPEPKKMVVAYEDRPKKLDEFYEQAAMIAKWYGCKLFIEMNKGGWRMKDYLEIKYPDLLQLSPKSAMAAKGGFEMRHGGKMNADKKFQMMGLIDEYTDSEENCKFIPSMRLIDQFKVFGGKGADDDLAVAFGWGLILVQADKTVAKHREQMSKSTPDFGFKKEGKQIFRTVGKDIFKGIKKYKSALFK